jgi:pteridine reductase
MTIPPVALVTGGAKRVGRAIVERLAAGGFEVAFTYFQSRTEADALIDAVARHQRRAVAIRADLTDPRPAAEHIHDAFRAEFARLDLLVNSASLFSPGDLRTATLEQMRQFWAIHVESPLLLCRAFESMLRTAGGSVVNMVDLLAEHPRPQHLAYCASKAALWNLTLGLARDLAPQVTVNGIAPGAVEWPPGSAGSQIEKYLARVPLGRVGSPEDVANLVHFLATEGKYITGQVIRLDGGRSIT